MNVIKTVNESEKYVHSTLEYSVSMEAIISMAAHTQNQQQNVYDIYTIYT
jgi:hypothetical protein